MPQAQFMEGDTVVAFRPMPARAPRPAVDDAAERGQLVLFTGVRYQRLAEEADQRCYDAQFPCTDDAACS